MAAHHFWFKDNLNNSAGVTHFESWGYYNQDEVYSVIMQTALKRIGKFLVVIDRENYSGDWHVQHNIAVASIGWAVRFLSVSTDAWWGETDLPQINIRVDSRKGNPIVEYRKPNCFCSVCLATDKILSPHKSVLEDAFNGNRIESETPTDA